MPVQAATVDHVLTPTVRVHCAFPACTATVELQLSTAVYGAADPFPEPIPIADTSRTGWRSWADRYWCAEHREQAPATFQTACAIWEAHRAAADGAWVAAHPAPDFAELFPLRVPAPLPELSR